MLLYYDSPSVGSSGNPFSAAAMAASSVSIASQASLCTRLLWNEGAVCLALMLCTMAKDALHAASRSSWVAIFLVLATFITSPTSISLWHTGQSIFVCFSCFVCPIVICPIHLLMPRGWGNQNFTGAFYILLVTVFIVVQP